VGGGSLAYLQQVQIGQRPSPAALAQPLPQGGYGAVAYALVARGQVLPELDLAASAGAVGEGLGTAIIASYKIMPEARRWQRQSSWMNLP